MLSAVKQYLILPTEITKFESRYLEFAVLAEEMVRFSHAIKSANLAIKQSLDMLSDRMTTYYDDSIVMKGQIDEFADALSQQMLRVQDKTQQLTESLTSTLTHMTESNGSLMAAS